MRACVILDWVFVEILNIKNKYSLNIKKEPFFHPQLFGGLTVFMFAGVPLFHR